MSATTTKIDSVDDEDEKDPPPEELESWVQSLGKTLVVQGGSKDEKVVVRYQDHLGSLQSGLGVDLKNLDEQLKLGKLLKNIPKEISKLLDAKKLELEQAFLSNRRDEVVSALQTRFKDPIQNPTENDIASEAKRMASAQLANYRSGSGYSEMKQQAKEKLLQTSDLDKTPGLTDALVKSDEDGLRWRVDAALNSMLNEDNLKEMSVSLGKDAQVSEEEMRARLVKTARQVFELSEGKQPMHPHANETPPPPVPDLLNPQAIEAIAEMSQYACLDADVFADKVNDPRDANKFIVSKKLSEMEGRAEKHGPAVIAGNNNASGAYKESDLETAADAVAQSRSGVCTTLGMAAAWALLAIKKNVGLDGVESVELVSGVASGGSGHCYVVLNRNRSIELTKPDAWLAGGCVLIDPWAGTLGCKSYYTDARDYPAGLRQYLWGKLKVDFASPE